MAPIRVGLVGLSSTVTGSLKPGIWASVAHLPWLLSSPDYKLVALANSSLEAAQKAVKVHNLPTEIKTYGSPEDLANDPDVDLVVVSVDVRKHYQLIKPALLAKKDAFVEWPLGANTAEAKELADLARANGSKTMVGLQARADPIVVKAHQIVQSGRLGELTSSSVMATFGHLPIRTWFKGGEYLLDKDSGGNHLTIFFGHFLDSFTQIVGDFDDLQSVIRTKYTTTTIMDSEGKVVQENYPRTTPDHIIVQGVLSNGAVASLSFRSVEKAVDDIGFRWLITGTEGELELTASERGWQMGTPDAKLRLRIGSNASEDIDYSTEQKPDVAKTPFPGANTSGLYDAFASGQTDRYATFERALELHKLLDSISQASM